MKSTIISDLANLGCRFAKQFPQDPVDPEITILQALNGFWEDKKIFTMLIGLLKFRLHQLINTKRLCCLAQKLSNSKRAVLYVLALKTYKHTKDER
mgnify:CR=1 FL=1